MGRASHRISGRRELTFPLLATCRLSDDIAGANPKTAESQRVQEINPGTERPDQ